MNTALILATAMKGSKKLWLASILDTLDGDKIEVRWGVIRTSARQLFLDIEDQIYVTEIHDVVLYFSDFDMEEIRETLVGTERTNLEWIAHLQSGVEPSNFQEGIRALEITRRNTA